MWALCKNALASVRFFDGTLAVFALLFVMPGTGRYTPSTLPSQVVTAGCGTVKSPFEEGACILLPSEAKYQPIKPSSAGLAMASCSG